MVWRKYRALSGVHKNPFEGVLSPMGGNLLESLLLY